MAAAGGAAWFAGSRAQRRHALHNYAAVLGLPETHPEVAAVARHAFENYARMLADFVVLGSMGAEELLAQVTTDGHEHLHAAAAEGRGCIMALPHMGSWDMVGAYSGAAGYRVATVVERFPGSLDRAVVDARSRFGLHVISFGRAAVRAMNQALTDNRILALLCDLPPPGGGGVEVRFFGCRAVVPAGPAAFACKHGVPLLPASLYRVGPGRYHAHIDAPILPPPGACGGKAGATALMQCVVERFEDYIRERPDQWYAFKQVLGEPIG